MARRFWKGLKNIFTTNVKDERLGDIDAACDIEERRPIPSEVEAFLNYKPEDIADQMTLMDWMSFKAVTHEELCHSARKDWKQSPNICALLARFVNVTTWVQDTVLRTPTVEKRAVVVQNFILIARRLYKLNNLHSTKAVMEGLHVVPILRLAWTWKHVSSKNKRHFRKLRRFYWNEQKVVKKMWQPYNSHEVRCIPDVDLILGGMKDDIDVDFTGHHVRYLQGSKYGHIRELPQLQGFISSISYTVEKIRCLKANRLSEAKTWKLLPPVKRCEASRS